MFERADEFLNFRAPNPYRLKRHQIREKQEADSPIMDEVIDCFPEESGIYFLFDYEYHIIYVGQSTNLKRRLKDHLNPNSKNSNVSSFPFTDVAFKIIIDNPTRVFLEAFYIFYYCPRYNYTYYQPVAYTSRAFIKTGANYFKAASPQDIVDLQGYLSYFKQERYVRIYGKLLFSHPDLYWWKIIKFLGENMIIEELNSYRNWDVKKHGAKTVMSSDFNKSKELLKFCFDLMKETYTFQYEMGLINNGDGS